MSPIPDNVQFTVNADATPPGGTLAATDELSDGSHAGLAKLLVSADGDRTPIPATAADGMLVEVSNASIPVTGGLTDAQLRATPVPVDASGSTVPVSNAGLTALNGAIAGTEVQTDIVAALPAGTNNIGDVDIASLPNEGQQTMANSISVAVASDQSAIPVSGTVSTGGLTDAQLRATPVPVDASGSTVPVSNAGLTALNGAISGTEVQVDVVAALPAGTNNIGDVDIASLPNEGQQTMANSISVAVASDQSVIPVVGGAANGSPVSGNPVYISGRASNAVPTDVGADGDAAGMWTQRNGAPVVTMAPHVGLVGSPWTLTSETAQYTTTQTSTVLVAGGASERIVVTKVQIQAGGTTAGTLQLYFGTGAYSRGTSLAIFDGEFAPSATLKPGVVMDGPFISATNGDDLMVTDSAAINPLTITVWYYVVT